MKCTNFLHFIVLLVCFNSVSAQRVKDESLFSVTCLPVNVDQGYTFLLDTVGVWTWNCPSVYGGGEEVVLQFTAPCTNTFKIEVTEFDYPNLHPLSIRTSTGSCTPGGFSCLTAVSSVYLSPGYRIAYEFPAVKDTTYDILIEYDYWWGNPLPAPLGVIIKTPHASGINLINVTPDSLSIEWTGSFDEVVLEYGPNGFVPGQDTTPGTQGTVVVGITSPFTVTGLDNDSVYCFYLRDRCGSSYGGNSVPSRVRIPQPDSLIVQLSPCPNSGFSGTFYDEYATHPCSWLSVNCGTGCPQSSPEVIRRFVPDSSGYHIFSKTGQGSTAPYFGSFYKEASLGLNESNWSCIGGGIQNTPWSHSFGPLVAGTPYYILVKATQDLGGACGSPPGIFSTTFRVECQGTCPILSNHQIISPTTSSLTFLLRQGSTLGYFIIEYGLAGFTPGTDSLPGTGGTTITPSGVYNNFVISGLLPGTTYDFYFRQYCTITGSFSSNSTVRSGTTLPICSVAPALITTNRINDAVCEGQSITLFQNGGLLSPGAYFIWYKDSCNTAQIGTGSYITVYPDSSGFYFVRPADTCLALPCTQVFVTVNPLPLVSLANPPVKDICLGDTVILQATVDTSWNYTWLRNGINLNAVNLPDYYAASGGLYSVLVTDSNACNGTSQAVKIRIVCFPPQDPVDRLSLIEDETNNSIMVKPNPGNGIFNVCFSEQINATRLSVINSLGKIIILQDIKGEKGQVKVDLSNQSPGMYLLVMESSWQVLSHKLFVAAQ